MQQNENSSTLMQLHRLQINDLFAACFKTQPMDVLSAKDSASEYQRPSQYTPIMR